MRERLKTGNKAVSRGAGKDPNYFGFAAKAVLDAGGPMTLGQMAPRMSPGLRPPPLFGKTPSPRCAIRPTIIFKQPCWQARDGYLSTKQRRPTTPVDAGRRGAQRSEVKEEAEGRGTRTELSAMSA